MDNFSKLKAIAILVCGGIASSAIADTTTTTNTTGASNNGAAVQVAKPSDATVTSNVNSALVDYSGKVNVTVKGGVVFLTGELPSDTDYDKVITAAESTKGVSDVNVDKLTVKDSASPLYDTYITAKVKGSLIQSDLMGKDIPSWSVSVETKDGQVYLSGKIATQQEKQNILNVVKAVKGVKNVNDKIEIAAVGTNATGTTTAPAADTNATGTTTTPAADTNATDTTTTTTTPAASDTGAKDDSADTTDKSDEDSSDEDDSSDE